MFGFSFAKILVLAIVVAVVWFGFRYFTALGQAAQQRARDLFSADTIVPRYEALYRRVCG
jgi:hypothetical protein